MRVVLVNGCFDMLHPGHIHFLKEARKRGDFLVVGLNIQSKTKTHYYSVEDRKLMLEALKFVDLVVPFPQDNAVHLIETFRPHVYVTGTEYKGFSPEARTVEEYKGKVFYVDRLGDYSTTKVKA